jgi:hypothetical protein
MTEQEEEVAGEGWRLQYDEESNETWLVLDRSTVRVVRTGELSWLKVLLPEELAEFLDMAWRNRYKPTPRVGFDNAVLAMFKDTRFGEWTAEGVRRIMCGESNVFLRSLRAIDKSTSVEVVAAALARLVAAGKLKEVRSGVFALDRVAVPVEEK